MRRLRVRVLFGADVTKVSGSDNDYEIFYTIDGKEYRMRSETLVFACGGPAGERLGQSDFGLRMLRSLGVPVNDPTPALVPLLCKNPHAKTVSGVRMEAGVTLTVGNESYKEHGEIVWTDYGISGIPVMQLSRYASEALRDGRCPVTIAVNSLPDMTAEEISAEIERRTSEETFRGRSAEEAMDGLVPKKLLFVLLKDSGIDPEAPVSAVTEKKREELVRRLAKSEYTVTGTRPWEYAQVMRGGVPLTAIDPESCEVRGHAGLFVTGELLDMDGNCGGYNLQWAFATGTVCGRAAARREARSKG